MADEITMQRLDQRIEWYDRHAAYNQRAYKVLKLIVIVAAALIPFLSGTEGFKPAWLVGALGVVIAVTEGIQQLNQHHVNWTSYRSTCEALKPISHQGRPLRRSDRFPRAVGRARRVAYVPGNRQMGNVAGRVGPGDSSSANKDG